MEINEKNYVHSFNTLNFENNDPKFKYEPSAININSQNSGFSEISLSLHHHLNEINQVFAKAESIYLIRIIFKNIRFLISFF